MENSTVLAYVLDGLEAYLELERELGVRAVEVDRALLTVAPAPRIEPATPKSAMPSSDAAREARLSAGTVSETRGRDRANGDSAKGEGRPSIAVGAKGRLDFVFIADRPLSPKAVEMMAKIIPAMGKTPETAPIVLAKPIPDARFFIFLGRAALARHIPSLRGEENRWLKSPGGRDVLLVKSPEEIVRYTTVTPALKKMKQEMWLALKTVLQRIRMEG